MRVRPVQRSMPRWLVIFLIFFVLGPFALPLLWVNDRFSRSAKYILTLVVLAYTAFVVWAVYALMQAVNSQVQGIMNQMPLR